MKKWKNQTKFYDQKLAPIYRRSLQHSNEDIQHFKTWKFLNFYLFLWVIFALLHPNPDLLTWLNPDSIRIWIPKTLQVDTVSQMQHTVAMEVRGTVPVERRCAPRSLRREWRSAWGTGPALHSHTAPAPGKHNSHPRGGVKPSFHFFGGKGGENAGSWKSFKKNFNNALFRISIEVKCKNGKRLCFALREFLDLCMTLFCKLCLIYLKIVYLIWAFTSKKVRSSRMEGCLRREWMAT